MELTELDSLQHRCVTGVLWPCMRASPDYFSEKKGNKKKLPFLTLVSEPLRWSDINIVFQFCLLHEVVRHRWKTLCFKLSHSLNLSAWRLPSMQFWNKGASFLISTQRDLFWLGEIGWHGNQYCVVHLMQAYLSSTLSAGRGKGGVCMCVLCVCLRVYVHLTLTVSQGVRNITIVPLCEVNYFCVPEKSKERKKTVLRLSKLKL